MKRIFLFTVVFLILLSCSNSGTRYKNPYLPNYTFSIPIDENLPLYSGLKSPINPVYINDGTSGVSGLIVMRVSETDYLGLGSELPEPISDFMFNNEHQRRQCEMFLRRLYLQPFYGRWRR
ncbi:hypothetical protein [Flavobacterium sp. 3HN19-14]|uniref:hypothetical protein n=1 Tax=Flavobacterium sp. 3HN19-14 TaxID=3448133 RepID=UPI003EE2811A